MIQCFLGLTEGKVNEKIESGRIIDKKKALQRDSAELFLGITKNFS
jgi:hypothetical protein